MNNPPLISVITPTLNNEKALPLFLESVRSQNYPQNNIEILVLDGGSTDQTLQIAKKYGAKTYFNERILADPGVDLGIKKATGEIMMILAVDNIYKDKNAFAAIAKVFEDPSIYAAFPKQCSGPTDSIFTKYINTFTDPFNHFVYGDAANARTFHKIYRTLEHNDIYDVYDFHSSKTKPLIAFAQGFALRQGYQRDEKDALDDLGPVISLIEKNKKIAYLHSLSLFHDTVRDLNHFIRKQKWATINALLGKSYGIAHRKEKLSRYQRLKIKIWPIYDLSVVLPLIRSVYGLFSDKEILWLFHPIICLISVYSSLISFVSLRINKKNIINRQ
jgi:glycosyltransferase involved in cell wall biosynthesis